MLTNAVCVEPASMPVASSVSWPGELPSALVVPLTAPVTDNHDELSVSDHVHDSVPWLTRLIGTLTMAFGDSLTSTGDGETLPQLCRQRRLMSRLMPCPAEISATAV